MTQDPSVFDPEGRAVPYIDEGHGDGPSLVLVSDRGLDGDVLGSIAHILVGEGFRVLRVGSGRAHATPDEQAADAVAVIEHTGVGAAWIGGHAGGGTLARLVASRHGSLGLLLLGVAEGDAPLPPAIPVLVVQGADDDTMPPERGERLRAAAPERVSVVSIGGAGRLFPVTHPVDTAFAIEDYLAWD
ncbi:MAG: alpha/beta hydrolase [Microbacterium sp.]|uniref:alpha/beta fold hydrolase n=1 Tax=Microbacterium sp. TaxID=51671 RepID=UPI0039E64D8B